LKKWRSSFTGVSCVLSTVDIVNLYPSLTICLVVNALTENLRKCSTFDESSINDVVEMFKLAISNKLTETQLINIQNKNSTKSEEKTNKLTGNKDNKNVCWSSQFKKLLKLSKEETKLF